MNFRDGTEEKSTIQLPYNSYIFSLPNTHVIKSKRIKDEEYIYFLIWILSFFIGVRLLAVATKNGFVCYAPLKRSHLTDFYCYDLCGTIELGRKFWQSGTTDNKVSSKKLVSAIHALYLAQKPQQLQLQFEEFIYSYIAIDTCYSILKKKTPHPRIPHGERIEWMCKNLELKVPDWAEYKKNPHNGKRESKLSALRNDAFHDGLYANAPLGNRPYKHERLTPIPYEMKNLVCRLIAAILGVQDTHYLKKEVFNRRQSRISLI